MVGFERVGAADVAELTAFLGTADLTLSGLDDPGVLLWLLRDGSGALVGSTGFELSEDGRHAIVRSVAVAPESRGAGLGTRLADHALAEAGARGATTAWLFSRRSGPFWQKLGFEPADRDALAAALATTRQVRLFVETGQLQREVAWSRALYTSELRDPRADDDHAEKAPSSTTASSRGPSGPCARSLRNAGAGAHPA